MRADKRPTGGKGILVCHWWIDCNITCFRSIPAMHWDATFPWLDFTSVLIGATVLLAAACLLLPRKKNLLPPGPSGLPIVGYVPFFGSNAAEDLRKMKSKYGAVMSIQMGIEHSVVLNDFRAIHEVFNFCVIRWSHRGEKKNICSFRQAFVTQADKFSGRTSNFMIDTIISEGCGVIFTDYGKTWKSLRKFGSRTLRGWGFIFSFSTLAL